MKLFSLTLLALLVITHLCDGFSVSRPYSSDSLTELIAEGNIFSARDAAKVTGLPNAPDIPSYAGYLTINETTDSNLFFWFFPSENKNAPVTVWLQGGPGAPSMYGLFTENGPFQVSDDMTVKLRKYSWTNQFSMLFIDQPVGTGFSYTTRDGYVRSQEEVGRDLFNFIQQFYTLFPEQKANDLWITGESYGGRYVPSFAYKLHQEKANSGINLKGIAVGDGFVDGPIMSVYSDLLYQVGMFDEREREEGKKIENKVQELAKAGKYKKCFEVMDSYIAGDRQNISLFTKASGSKNYFNFLEVVEASDPFMKYLARDDVRKAIHVGNRTLSDGNQVYDHLLEDFCKSVKPWLEELVDAGYEVLLYNGQLDIIVGPTTTERLIHFMNWKGKSGYQQAPKKIWKVPGHDDDVAGYVTSYQNFHFAVVRKAGHMVPADQPENAYNLIQNFVAGKL